MKWLPKWIDLWGEVLLLQWPHTQNHYKGVISLFAKYSETICNLKETQYKSLSYFDSYLPRIHHLSYLEGDGGTGHFCFWLQCKENEPFPFLQIRVSYPQFQTNRKGQESRRGGGAMTPTFRLPQKRTARRKGTAEIIGYCWKSDLEQPVNITGSCTGFFSPGQEVHNFGLRLLCEFHRTEGVVLSWAPLIKPNMAGISKEVIPSLLMVPSEVNVIICRFASVAKSLGAPGVNDRKCV